MTALAATGVKVAALEQAPEIPLTLIPALRALRELDGERSIGFGGAGLIPWRAILAYAREYRVPDRENFIELVQHGDAVLLEARDAARERSTPKTQRSATPDHKDGRAGDSISAGRYQGGARPGGPMGSRGRR